MDLPIELRQIVTPYNLAANESANMVVTSNNKASFVRRGGFFHTLDLGITPFNLRVESQAEAYWRIVGFLNKYPSFAVPIHNMQPNKMETSPGNFQALTVLSGPYVPGYTGGILTQDLGAAYLNPGQYIKFSTNDKLYQVEYHDTSAERIYLTQPLSHTVRSTNSIVHNEVSTDVGHPMENVNFNGIWCEFLNEDFGNPINRIEDGIMGMIGPLKLREKL